MAEIRVTGLNEAQRQLEVTSTHLTRGVERVLRDAGGLALQHMKTRFLSGSPLKPQSGKLRSNWQVRGQRLGSEYVVTVSTNTAYARAQNYGVRGVQQVKAHTRRISAPSSPQRRGGVKKQLRSRSESRARSEHRSRLNAQAHASHGVSKSSLNRLKLEQRKARGIQRGAFGAAPKLSDAQRQRGGYVAVRAHDRFMKLRGHRYVERTLREVKPRIEKLLDRFQRGLMDGRATT